MSTEKISYYSTNLKARKVSFSEALLKGLAPDKGLFMPDHIPVFEPDELKSLKRKSYPEIAFTVSRRFLKDEISDKELLDIVNDAYNYDVPLEKVYERKYVMRLDCGPTASFKDFAARMMGRLMQHFLQQNDRKLNILTATSGDTGSAIANAFYGLSNINVVILFPQQEVTDRQRKQMTTLRKNIRIVAIDGKFDDCQALVKQAFTDGELSSLNLSSANSINIGRLLPQSFYYFYAWSQLAADDEKVLFSVPSGNFGNMMGGLLARYMGLPVHRFIIATNENDEVPVYWQTGNYKTIVPSRNCISSAMNVGHPSNMARVVALYGGIMDERGMILKDPDVERMHNDIYAVSISDESTELALKEAWTRHNLLLEPHGAAGWAGMHEYFRSNAEDPINSGLCICLETAHPAKFPEVIRRLINIEPQLPPSLQGLEKLEESYDHIVNDYQAFKSYLLKRFR